MNYHELTRSYLQGLQAVDRSPLRRELDELMRGEVGMLSYLHYEHDGATSGELSDKLNVSTARTAAALKNLEKKQMLVRKQDSEDRRRVLVYITETGRTFVTAKHDRIVDTLTSVLSNMGQQDAAELARLTGRLAELAAKK